MAESILDQSLRSIDKIKEIHKYSYNQSSVHMKKLRLIPIETLLEMLENEERFRLVEVLDKIEYDKGHIPGAINIPLDKLETLSEQELKKTDTILVYCASYVCHASTKAARKLLELGYKNVFDFKGGKRWWQHAGLDLEK